CRPAALPPLPEPTRKAGKCSPSPTSPQAQPPIKDLILMRLMADSSTQPSHPRRSEPISKPAGLHLKKRPRLSHVRGPPPPFWDLRYVCFWILLQDKSDSVVAVRHNPTPALHLTNLNGGASGYFS